MSAPLPTPDDLPSRIGKAMWLAAWVVGFAILVLFFDLALDRAENPNPDPVAISDTQGRPQVVLARNRAGHYVASGKINGQPVIFLVDTGATDVALPIALARSLDLPFGGQRIARTANGDVTTWGTVLARVELGGLAARDVRASILPDMAGDQVLLGMSWLKRFELIQRDGSLIIRPPG